MTVHTDLQTVAEIIADDSTIALGGMTLYRRPVAFVKALLARKNRPNRLTLMNFTSGFESDLLVGAGCVKAIRTVYFGLEAFGLAPMFTEFANRGDLQVIEETEASIVAGLRATTSGIGFMPSRAWVGTDLPRLREDVLSIVDPYTGEKLYAFPSIHIDAVIVHGLAGDEQGNVMLNNNLGIDLELIYAADYVIATVEKVVKQLNKSVNGTIIPSPGIDYMVVAPLGAYPTSCFPEYMIDGTLLLNYVEACNAGKFDTFLSDFLGQLSNKEN